MQKFWPNPPALRPSAPPCLLPAEVRVGKTLRIAPATVLAPMSGITDTVFRQFIRGIGGCGLIMTEFTSGDGIIRSAKVARRYLSFTDAERPIAAQLFGSDPDVMAEAAALVEQLGFDSVDLNLGCPAKKVVKCNGGSGLLRDLPLLGSLFERIRAAVRIPFTVKFRAGWDERHLVHVELARMAEARGVDALSLHARTREQGYSGEARWQWIAEVKQAVSIPVFGNGDVRRPQDAAALVAQTGCDGVMIGRAAASNPWIFRQMEQYRATGGYDEPDDRDRRELMLEYFGLLIALRQPGALGKMKQFAAWFTHGIRGGANLRHAVYHASSEQAVVAAVKNFFDSERPGTLAADAPDCQADRQSAHPSAPRGPLPVGELATHGAADVSAGAVADPELEAVLPLANP
jgi:tRNA-dihydrouridine synthase B